MHMMDVNKLKSRLYLATTTKLASVHHELTDKARAARSFSSQCSTLRYLTAPNPWSRKYDAAARLAPLSRLERTQHLSTAVNPLSMSTTACQLKSGRGSR